MSSLRTVLAIMMQIFITIPVASPAVAEQSFREGDSILLQNLTDAQSKVVEETFRLLKSLEGKEIRINKGVYDRLGRFEELFRFPFKGEAVYDWLLSRIRSITLDETWTVAINRGRGRFVVGEAFFTQLSSLERIYLLIHEARHSDGDGHPHVRCPEGFNFISAAQPEMDLEHERACDATGEGAYGYQAAFLFELYARGIFDQKQVGLLYNSSISRIVP